MSTRNRAESLNETLAAIAAQRFAPNFTWELILVDNGSTDRTPAVADEWAGRLPLVKLYEPVAGKNRGLNRALEICRGRLIAFTDDDVTPEVNWLQELHEGSARWPDDDVFGGKITPQFPGDSPQFLTAPTFAFSEMAFARYNPQAIEGPVTLEPFGPNVIIRRRVFDKFRFSEMIGPAGENYAMGSETELLQRLASAGLRFIFLPLAMITHRIRADQCTLRWLWRRSIMAGRGGTRMGGVWTGASIMGIPRFLWRRLLESVALLPVAAVLGQQRRWEAVMRVGCTLGAMCESRAIAAKQRTVPLEVAATNGLELGLKHTTRPEIGIRN